MSSSSPEKKRQPELAGEDEVRLGPVTLNQVLYEELETLRPELFKTLDPLDLRRLYRDEKARRENLEKFYTAVGLLSADPNKPNKRDDPERRDDPVRLDAPDPFNESGRLNEPDQLDESGQPSEAAPSEQAGEAAPSDHRDDAPRLVLGKGPLTALCLSGGGIRSATFNLGVLQYLAKIGLLRRFDYLSSVSGGGYIAGWLRTWIHRAGLNAVVNKLGARESGVPKARPDPLSPEPRQVRNLREYSNYLTPAVGLFSGDTWAAAAIIARNLLLNWLVLLPLIAAVIGIPLVFLLVVRTTGILDRWGGALWFAAILIETLASVCLYAFRRFAKDTATPQGYFILFCVAPVVLAAGTLATAALALVMPWHETAPKPLPVDYMTLALFSILWCVVVPVLGWSGAEVGVWLCRLLREKSEPRTSANSNGGSAAKARIVPWKWELFGLFASGLIGAALLVAVTNSWLAYLYGHPALYVILVLPILLGIYLISRALFVGIVSLSESFPGKSKPGGRSGSDLIFSEDADREWWARLSGWVLLVIVSWVVVTAICLFGSYGPEMLDKVFPGKDGQSGGLSGAVQWLVGAMGAVSGALAAFTGSRGDTPAAPNTPVARPATKIILAVAGPLFIVCVIILLSWGLKALGGWVAGEQIFSLDSDFSRLAQPPQFAAWWSFPCVVVGLAAASVLAGSVVNVNRFSLHGMYRNRLIRAYLGASNCIEDTHKVRLSDPFTGFAMSDNVALHELCFRAGAEQKEAGAQQKEKPDPREIRPLPIINTTLNLVNGQNLAWQQRKAASFSMTPLYCGSWTTGYRSSRDYGGTGGLTVGTAITISGAAANPNMGYSSSPVLGFLMAMFNVRLGAWLGNTNEKGNVSYRRHGPRQAIMPLFAEMFGLTNASRKYVNLSDGGHFDNLGLYEVVLRRCRNVLVCDAGQDGSFSFEDLGNAVRKIRIDFGIDITFSKEIEFLPDSRGKKRGVYCAIGTIHYSDIDGTPRARDGKLIYIKPSLRGRSRKEQVLPYDIYSYSRGSKDFPHETTADQWFSESQFESYRALGRYILAQLGGTSPYLTDCSFEKFYRNVEDYLREEGP
jgi:hypothetical protein